MNEMKKVKHFWKRCEEYNKKTTDNSGDLLIYQCYITLLYMDLESNLDLDLNLFPQISNTRNSAPAEGCSLQLQPKGPLGPKVILPDKRLNG